MGCGLVLGNAAPSVSSCLGSALLSTVRNLYFRLTLTLPFPQRPPKCPASRDASLATITCVEGASGARLFADPTASFKSAAFSQYVLYTYRQEKKGRMWMHMIALLSRCSFYPCDGWWCSTLLSTVLTRDPYLCSCLCPCDVNDATSRFLACSLLALCLLNLKGIRDQNCECG